MDKEEFKFTNRKWQNHIKSKGLIPFLIDRSLSYGFSMSRQYKSNPFDFLSDNDENNPFVGELLKFLEEFPYEIFIEVTNNCNLKCVFCARENMSRDLGFMDMNLHKKIIDEVAEKRNFAHIHMYGVGEPTMDPLIVDKIKYAIDKNVKNLVLFTNGNLLSKNDLYKKLADTGIGTIGIDLDGFSKESYEKIRIGGKYEVVKKNIEGLSRYIKDNNLATRVELAYQLYEGINNSEQETELFRKWATKNDYEYKFVPMHHWAGLRKDIPIDKNWDSSREIIRERPCSALWQNYTIFWNGDIPLCYMDADGKEIMGNINNSSIEEIWKGKLKEKRKDHVNGKFNGLCENCKEYLYEGPPKCGSTVYPIELREK